MGENKLNFKLSCNSMRVKKKKKRQSEAFYVKRYQMKNTQHKK